MDTRELPVLTNEDRDLIERLAIGLDDDTARVLAYLLRRSEMEGFGDDPATRLAVRIGTSLNRETVADALNHLEERDLVAATTLSTDGYGRPPTVWHAPESTETTVRRIDERHTTALLEQARTVASEFGADPVEETGSCNDHTAPEPLRLGLNWSPNALHAPFFAAAATGNYEANGLDVAIDYHWGSGRALDSLVAGTSDVVLAGAATTIRAREAGKPIVPVALLFQRAMAVLYTTRETFGGRFETIEQLRGRRVGMSDTSETGLLGRLFLSQAGILDDVTVVDITGEEQAALRSGRAAVVTGSFADPQQVATESHTVDSLLVTDQFPMYGPALVTTERTLREHRPALRRFLAGTVTGWATAVADPEAAIRAVARDEQADESALDADRRTFKRAVREFATGDAVEKHGWGWHRAAGWNRLVTALNHAGLLVDSP
jgi:ABC-type nitrate/sulfonate/bicarbonate transport system substrate-binding protein/predicted transcriptional regulator